jgi:hypothetical protein
MSATNETQTRNETMTKRQAAITSGVENAVDTVVIDRAMSAKVAYEQLGEFVQSALSQAKLTDIVTQKDMSFAKNLWPLDI